MEQRNSSRDNDFLEIDLLRVVAVLWKNAILILAAGIFCGGIAFAVTKLSMTPRYSSSVTLYVNNKKDGNAGNASISSSDITSAKYLVKTYIAILKTRESLQLVKEDAQVEYSTESLKKMISAAVVDDTEVFRVTVTTDSPYISRDIAESISRVLPKRIAEIIEGSTMRVVDPPIVEPKKVAPSTTKNVAIGALLGAFLVSAAVIIRDLLDDTIHNEDYFLQHYSIPVLASIPDLLQDDGKKYGRYGGYESAGCEKNAARGSRGGSQARKKR